MFRVYDFVLKKQKAKECYLESIDLFNKIYDHPHPMVNYK